MQKGLLFFISIIFLLSCKKNSSNENVQVKISMENFSGKTGVNRNYNISTARMYFSNFSLVDSSGNEMPVKDLIIVKSTNTADQNSFSFPMPAGNFTKFRFHFGLDYATNHNVDPATFDASNPLSLSQDMFWGMLRYRFIVVEGTLDASPAKDQNPSNPFSMHLGTDTLYREVTTDLVSITKGSEIKMNVDLSKIFILDADPFQITNFSNHSEPSEIPRAITITNNLVNSISTVITNPG